MKPISALTVSFAFGLISTCTAQILYQDDYSGSSSNPLNATTPDMTIGANTWNATTFRADGSVAGYGYGVLPFVPVSGKIYTLSATLNNNSSVNWMTIGFVTTLTDTNVLFQSEALVGISTDTDPVIIRHDGTFSMYTPAGYSSGQTAAIVLDTQLSSWKADYYYGGTLIQSSSWPGAPSDIVGVGIGSNFSSGSIDNFSLSSVPEPSTLVSVGLLGSMLAIGSRGRRSRS